MSDSDRIRPYTSNPHYWQYKGNPLLLLGGTKEDNLFQILDLEEHLDLIVSVGGNYIRMVMSDRDEGDVRAFHRLPTGKYDLDRWNEEYWQRFQTMLELTHEREIIVQIEVWDRFDHSNAPWQTDPYHPKNNINYTGEESGLETAYPEHPARNKQPFFDTVPALNNNPLLLKYQQAFVDKLLSDSLQYDHVLYCMDNETSGSREWGEYWNAWIKKRASEVGKTVETTEMFDRNFDNLDYVVDHPEIYSFVEVNKLFAPQRWAPVGENQWHRVRAAIERLGNHPRPLTMVKLRGVSEQLPGDQESESIKKYWRALFAGVSALRFHRPPSLGLSQPAQATIRSVRNLERTLKLWDAEPRMDLLRDRENDSAYLIAEPPKIYALYFTDGGSVGLNLSDARNSLSLKWLNIRSGEWETDEGVVNGGDIVIIKAPARGGWVAIVRSNFVPSREGVAVGL